MSGLYLGTIAIVQSENGTLPFCPPPTIADLFTPLGGHGTPQKMSASR